MNLHVKESLKAKDDSSICSVEKPFEENKKHMSTVEYLVKHHMENKKETKGDRLASCNDAAKRRWVAHCTQGARAGMEWAATIPNMVTTLERTVTGEQARGEGKGGSERMAESGVV